RGRDKRVRRELDPRGRTDLEPAAGSELDRPADPPLAARSQHPHRTGSRGRGLRLPLRLDRPGGVARTSPPLACGRRAVPLHGVASFNARETPSGRLIQGADALAIQNEFLIQALSLVPPHATYVVEQPVSEQVARTYGIPRTPLLALRGYVRFLLLPRREARPARAQYLLCYACDTDPFDKRGMQRLLSDPKGLVIGRLNP